MVSVYDTAARPRYVTIRVAGRARESCRRQLAARVRHSETRCLPDSSGQPAAGQTVNLMRQQWS
jgi:hypothetical protein